MLYNKILHSEASCAIIQKCLKQNKAAHKTQYLRCVPCIVYIFCTWNRSGSVNKTRCTRTAATPQRSPLLTTRRWERTAYFKYCSILYKHPEGPVNKWRSWNKSRKPPLTYETWLRKGLGTRHLQMEAISKIFFFLLWYPSSKRTPLQEKRTYQQQQTALFY